MRYKNLYPLREKKKA